MNNPAEHAVRRFVADLMNQVERDNALQPPLRPLVEALSRTGLLATVMTQTAAGEHPSWDHVYQAAVNAAAMLLRVALTGDASVTVPELTDAGGLVRHDRNTGAKILNMLGFEIGETRTAPAPQPESFGAILHDDDAPFPPEVFRECHQIARRLQPDLDPYGGSISQNLLARILGRLWQAGCEMPEAEKDLHGDPTYMVESDTWKTIGQIASRLAPGLVQHPDNTPACINLLMLVIKSLFYSGWPLTSIESCLQGIRPQALDPATLTTADAAPAVAMVPQEADLVSIPEDILDRAKVLAVRLAPAVIQPDADRTVLAVCVNMLRAGCTDREISDLLQGIRHKRQKKEGGFRIGQAKKVTAGKDRFDVMKWTGTAWTQFMGGVTEAMADGAVKRANASLDDDHTVATQLSDAISRYRTALEKIRTRCEETDGDGPALQATVNAIETLADNALAAPLP